eukprot:g24396.t1
MCWALCGRPGCVCKCLLLHRGQCDHEASASGWELEVRAWLAPSFVECAQVLLKEYFRHRKLTPLESEKFVDFMAAGALACGFYRFCEFNVRQKDADAKAKESYRLMAERAEQLLEGPTREVLVQNSRSGTWRRKNTWKTTLQAIQPLLRPLRRRKMVTAMKHRRKTCSAMSRRRATTTRTLPMSRKLLETALQQKWAPAERLRLVQLGRSTRSEWPRSMPCKFFWRAKLLAFRFPFHEEELKIEQFKKLAPKVFHSAPAWIPQKESSKSKAVKRQSPAKQTSQDSERWESKPEESQAAKPEELQHSAEEAQELEGGHTKAEESQAPEEPQQHTAEEAEDLESGHAKAEESQAPEEPQHTAEEAEELESGHAKAENRDAEEHQHSAERAPSEEPEDFEGTPKARESSEGQDDMPKDDSVDALAEDDSGAEDEDFSHSSVMELRRKHHVHARKVDRIARLHRLHGLQREAMLELQLRQDQQLEELRQELERHRRHEDDELERFREREELEREQMRIDGESSDRASALYMHETLHSSDFFDHFERPFKFCF